jgi:hypothetical protein
VEDVLVSAEAEPEAAVVMVKDSWSGSVAAIWGTDDRMYVLAFAEGGYVEPPRFQVLGHGLIPHNPCPDIVVLRDTGRAIPKEAQLRMRQLRDTQSYRAAITPASYTFWEIVEDE